MLGVERLDGIMEMLKDGQAVSIHTLSKALYISEIWPPCKRRG